MQNLYYKLFLIFVLLSSVLSGRAQFVNFGQDRTSLHWKQIHTKDFQIIFILKGRLYQLRFLLKGAVSNYTF